MIVARHIVFFFTGVFFSAPPPPPPPPPFFFFFFFWGGGGGGTVLIIYYFERPNFQDEWYVHAAMNRTIYLERSHSEFNVFDIIWDYYNSIMS